MVYRGQIMEAINPKPNSVSTGLHTMSVFNGKWQDIQESNATYFQLRKKSKTKTQFMARFINDSNIEIIKQFRHKTVINS